MSITQMRVIAAPAAEPTWYTSIPFISEMIRVHGFNLKDLVIKQDGNYVRVHLNTVYESVRSKDPKKSAYRNELLPRIADLFANDTWISKLYWESSSGPYVRIWGNGGKNEKYTLVHVDAIRTALENSGFEVRDTSAGRIIVFINNKVPSVAKVAAALKKIGYRWINGGNSFIHLMSKDSEVCARITVDNSVVNLTVV